MDDCGRTFDNDQLKDQKEVNLAYLKLINVPTMFDIGCTQADPCTDSLTLSMLDRET